MACLSVVQRRGKFTREHLVVRVMTMVRAARPTAVAPWLTGQVTHFCTPFMGRYSTLWYLDLSFLDLWLIHCTSLLLIFQLRKNMRIKFFTTMEFVWFTNSLVMPSGNGTRHNQLSKKEHVPDPASNSSHYVLWLKSPIIEVAAPSCCLTLVELDNCTTLDITFPEFSSETSFPKRKLVWLLQQMTGLRQLTILFIVHKRKAFWRDLRKSFCTNLRGFSLY